MENAHLHWQVKTWLKQVFKEPSDPVLAFLLGIAIGVMAFLSIVEMLIHNATKAVPAIVVVTFFAGYLGFLVFDKSIPDFDAV